MDGWGKRGALGEAWEPHPVEMEEWQEKGMNLQPQMAPCVCPPADKQIPFELWGCNSVWGRCKGRGGEAVGLFGGL